MHCATVRWDHVVQPTETVSSLLAWSATALASASVRDAPRTVMRWEVDVPAESERLRWGDVVGVMKVEAERDAGERMVRLRVVRLGAKGVPPMDVAGVRVEVDVDEKGCVESGKLLKGERARVLTVLPSDAALLAPSRADQAAHVVRMMFEAIGADPRPRIRRVAVAITHVPVVVGTPLTLISSANAEPETFELRLPSNDHATAVARMQVWYDAATPLEPRYEKGTSIGAALCLRSFANETRGQKGFNLTTVTADAPEVASTDTFAAFVLHAADVSTSVVWEHLLDDNAPFANEKAADGMRRFTCFWRAANVDVRARPRPGSRILARNWVSRAGKTSFELTVDFFAGNDASTPIASARYSMVVVERLTMSPSPIFFDSQLVQERYGSCVSFADPRPAIPDLRDLATRDRVFVHAPADVRHYHQDANGHVNSGLYMHLVGDVRAAAIASGFFPRESRAASLLGVSSPDDAWISRFGISYDAEVRLGADAPSVELSFDDAAGVFWFVFFVESGSDANGSGHGEGKGARKPATKIWVVPRPLLSSGERSPYPWVGSDAAMGVVPQQWGVAMPSSLL